MLFSELKENNCERFIMLDRTVMIGLLETYDSFLSELFVSVLRQIEDSKPKVERKIVDFLKGKMFPVSVEKLTEYLQKSPVESLRDRVVENLWEMHSILMDLVIFIGSEGGRQPVYQPLIRMMEKDGYRHRALAMATLCSFDLPEAVNKLCRILFRDALGNNCSSKKSLG